ncbi:hypothetical protein BCL93_103346 [Onishia taeanensis]|uniref:Uncharacterized protein n=2 Tax=Onishia taeanensis TaxID=284577 RepID=A0A328XZV5_9GAMM|nr:hypothetical protein BCL93_103346 [Halomonas taeanensis]
MRDNLLTVGWFMDSPIGDDEFFATPVSIRDAVRLIKRYRRIDTMHVGIAAQPTTGETP